MKRTLLKFAAAALLFGILFFVEVPARPAIRLCGFYWLTGRPCPFCGLTRALFALAKGRWHDAIAFHALSPVAFVLAFSLFSRFPQRQHLWTAGLGAILVYGVLRAALL